MRTNPPSARRSRRGYALLLVLVMISISLVILGATMNRTSTVAMLNERSNERNACLQAADAATEKVVAQMRADFVDGGDAAVAANLPLYTSGSNTPSASEDSFWSGFEFSDGQGNVGHTFTEVISNRVYTPLSGPYTGLNGWETVYRVLSNVRKTDGLYDVTGAVQQDVALYNIPVFQFAIFYNSLLEFTWAAPMTVRGRVHANNSIFTGSSSKLEFTSDVTASGTIQKKAWDGYSLSQMSGSIKYDDGYTTNAPVLALPIGTNITADAVREILNMPPAGEAVDSAMGEERYYNKAGLVLLVSNTAVTAIIKSTADDSSPVTISSSTNNASLTNAFPFLDIATNFYDEREDKTIKTTQIDVAKYAYWISTNTYTSPSGALTKHPSSNPLNIIYVADNRTMTSSQLTAVRLIHGTNLPPAEGTSGKPTGFSVATPNPLYILGDYNCTNASYLGTTNTSASVPASLASDALTILSKNWSDSKSTQSLNNRNDAVNTTINAAILTGIVYSQGSNGNAPFSGGVMNLPRLLEDWGDGAKHLTLNTSIVSLFNSVKATAPFQSPGNYYYAPTRDFNFDPNFTDPTKLPPGTPCLSVLMRSRWANPPAGVVNYER